MIFIFSFSYYFLWLIVFFHLDILIFQLSFFYSYALVFIFISFQLSIFILILTCSHFDFHSHTNKFAFAFLFLFPFLYFILLIIKSRSISSCLSLKSKKLIKSHENSKTPISKPILIFIRFGNKKPLSSGYTAIKKTDKPVLSVTFITHTCSQLIKWFSWNIIEVIFIPFLNIYRFYV